MNVLQKLLLEKPSKKEKQEAIKSLWSLLEKDAFSDLSQDLIRSLMPLLSSEVKKAFASPQKPKTIIDWLASACAKDAVRPQLEKIRQLKNRAVATDGHCLHIFNDIHPDFKGKNAIEKGLAFDTDERYPEINHVIPNTGVTVDFSIDMLKSEVVKGEAYLCFYHNEEKIAYFSPKIANKTISFLKHLGDEARRKTVLFSDRCSPLLIEFYVDNVRCQAVIMPMRVPNG